MKNKKLRNGLLVVSLSLLILPSLILAAAPLKSPETDPNQIALTENAIYNVIIKVRNWVYTIFGIVAVIFIVLAAFDYLTSGGDPTKVKAAQSKLIYALVAIAVALIAGGATALIREFITT